MKQQINKAQLLGTSANFDGKPCVPALDKELMKMIEGNKVGDKMNILLMQAFVKGRTLANLAK